MLVSEGQAEAQNHKRTYSAYELTRDLVLQSRQSDVRVSATLFQGGSVLPCVVTVERKKLVVKRDTTCPLFTQTPPAKFMLVIEPTGAECKDTNQALPECTTNITYELGPATAVRGRYDGSVLRLTNEWSSDARTSDVCVATVGKKGWKAVTYSMVVTAESVEAKPPTAQALPRQGDAFLRLGKCEAPVLGQPILRLSYVFAQKTSDHFPHDCWIPSPKECPRPALGAYPNAGVAWVLYVDQANSSGTPRIAHNPNNYIRPNSFGRVRIRHWKNVIPSLSLTGAGAALTTPNESGGTGADRDTPAIGASQLGKDGDAIVSEFLIGPRAPGALNLAMKFSDVTDPKKTHGEIGAEILVDKVYSGTFRFGLSRILKLEDIEYVGVQQENMSYKITKNSSPAQEIVLGVALYSQLLSNQGGRTYFLRPKYSEHWYCRPFEWLWRHSGLYVGIGALSYTPKNVDFLKSVHLGVELEFTSNLSLALTTAIRRTPVLGDGMFVGDSIATSSVNTTDTNRAGLGIVLNVSVDFLKFAVKGGQ